MRPSVEGLSWQFAVVTHRYQLGQAMVAGQATQGPLVVCIPGNEVSTAVKKTLLGDIIQDGSTARPTGQPREHQRRSP